MSSRPLLTTPAHPCHQMYACPDLDQGASDADMVYPEEVPMPGRPSDSMLVLRCDSPAFELCASCVCRNRTINDCRMRGQCMRSCLTNAGERDLPTYLNWYK